MTQWALNYKAIEKSDGKYLSTLFERVMEKGEPSPYDAENSGLKTGKIQTDQGYEVLQIHLPEPRKREECESIYLCDPPDLPGITLPPLCICSAYDGKKKNELCLHADGGSFYVQWNDSRACKESDTVKDLCDIIVTAALEGQFDPAMSEHSSDRAKPGKKAKILPFKQH